MLGSLAPVLILAAAASGGGVAGCLRWEPTATGFEFGCDDDAMPLSYCRPRSAGDGACAVECLAADPACDVWWRRVTP